MSESIRLECCREDRECPVVIITLQGQLDGNSCPAFCRFLKEHLGEDDLAIVLDCSELAFISSAGLREWLNLAKRLNQHGRKAALCGMTSKVSMAVEISGFNTLFYQTDQVEEAIRCVSPDNKEKAGIFGRLFQKH